MMQSMSKSAASEVQDLGDIRWGFRSGISRDLGFIEFHKGLQGLREVGLVVGIVGFV